MYNCKRCNKECCVKYGSGIFCSRQCANSRLRNSEVKAKISAGVRNCSAYLEGRMNPNPKSEIRIKHFCSICKKTFLRKPCWKGKFCSLECSRKNPNMGGYRPGSGRSKSGWYKGFYCGSTWELAFLIWCLEHQLPIERCTTSFSYKFEEKVRSYLPDFMINDIFIEIKGYNTSQTAAKIKQFPSKLVVLYEEDLQHVFEYVKSIYGKDFVNLYEGNPYNQKNNACKMCGNACKKVYCSQRCSIFGNHYKKEKLVTHVGAAPTPPA